MAVITDADARRWPVLDDDDHSSDTSSILTEIGSQDFPNYFFERDNRLFPSQRLFPSHGDLFPSYPFPVDGHEQNVRVFRDCTLSLPYQLRLSSLTHALVPSRGLYCCGSNGMHIANECSTRSTQRTVGWQLRRSCQRCFNSASVAAPDQSS